MKKPENEYHHPNLRRALMDAAIAHLQNGDITQLNMHLLARAAGVTKGAPYYHFENKEAIVKAIAIEGFQLLLHALQEQTSHRQQRVRDIARVYLIFAERFPVHYRLMFLPEWSNREEHADLHGPAADTLSLLVDAIAAVNSKASEPQRLAIALRVFSYLHGFAALVGARVLTSVPGAPPLSAQRKDAEETVCRIAEGPVT